jgi:hypothetical protein
LNALTGHRSCAPEDCGKRPAYLAAGAGAGYRHLSGGRLLAPSGDWDSGSLAFAISRGSPGAPSLIPGHGHRFPGMLFSLASFRIPVSHQIQRYLLSSLPAARAIQQCASWRTVGSNPTPATHLRRSKPVTPDGVTGFSAQNERLQKRSALFRGLCVGRIRPSPGLCGCRRTCRLSCRNASGGGCLRAVLRAGRARWPWAVRGAGGRFAYI